MAQVLKNHILSRVVLVLYPNSEVPNSWVPGFEAMRTDLVCRWQPNSCASLNTSCLQDALVCRKTQLHGGMWVSYCKLLRHENGCTDSHMIAEKFN